MLLKKVTLEDIRSYRKATISFPEGSVLLSGDIGSGKSSILLAIEFALFGSTAGSRTGQTLLRNGAKRGSVELTFSIGKKDYTIRRTLRRGRERIGQEPGHLVEDGVLHELTPQELRSRVLGLLNYPQELLKKKSLLFRYTVYTPQEEMRAIIRESPEERLDILRKVFGIDRYKRIVENCAAVKEEQRGSQRQYEGESAGLEERERSRKETAATRARKEALHAEVRHRHDILARTLAERRQAVLERERAVEEYRSWENEAKVLAIRLADRQDQLEEKGRQSTELRAALARDEKELSLLETGGMALEAIEDLIEALAGRIHSHEAARRAAAEKVMFLEAQVGEAPALAAAREELTERMAAKEKELRRAEEGIAAADKEATGLEAAREELARSERKMVQYQATVERAQEVVADFSSLELCPRCRQPVDDTHKGHILAEEERLIRENKGRLEEERVRAAGIKARLDDAQGARDRAQVMRTQASVLQAELDGLARRKGDLAAQAEKVERYVNDLEAAKREQQQLAAVDLGALRKERTDLDLRRQELLRSRELRRSIDERKSALATFIAEQERLAAESEGIARQAQAIRERLAREGSRSAAHTTAKAAYERALAEEKACAIQNAEAGKEVEAICERLRELDAEIATLREAREKAAKAAGIAHWIDAFFVPFVQSVERQILYSVHREFNELFSQWFSMLIEDDALQVRLDDTFTPTVEQDGYETDSENLSGGERTALALAYRLALNRVINDLTDIRTKDLLILDEPTDGFSSAQLDRMRDVLDELRTRQVLIVSHETKIESFVERIIRVTKDGHESSAAAG
ncbi:SMC family ATPase [Candidatus Woesearchaeota archaeon]|nr:SMC family ATPase [Candidatus Woesearchaeota archaeon]